MDDKTQKIILNAPYYSQHLDIKDEHWKTRACGIVCLKMAMDNLKETGISLDALIEMANKRGGFGEFGWIHDFLVQIAKEFGFNAERKEWKSETESAQEILIYGAIQEFAKLLSNGSPVIVSTVKNFLDEDKFHLVLLTGYETDGSSILGFYYHDPDSLSASAGKHKFVPIDIFKKRWRKLAIYVKI